MTWGIMFSRLALAKSHIKSIDHDLNPRSASPTTRTRRLLSEPQFISSSSSATEVSSGYRASATSYSAVSTSSNDYSKVTATPAPTTLAINQPISTTPTCDATQPKFAINNLLVTYNGKLRENSDCIVTLTNQVREDNSQQIGGLIAAELQKTITALTTCLSSVQVCGTDPKPLSANKGINLSDVSWSAFQIVLTLKTVFESVSCLYKPFPAIRQTCSDILLKLSTALASLIGACGEQINLFDTRFFPLVTPQLKEFTDIDDNFSSFFGSFVA